MNTLKRKADTEEYTANKKIKTDQDIKILSFYNIVKKQWKSASELKIQDSSQACMAQFILVREGINLFSMEHQIEFAWIPPLSKNQLQDEKFNTIQDGYYSAYLLESKYEFENGPHMTPNHPDFYKAKIVPTLKKSCMIMINLDGTSHGCEQPWKQYYLKDTYYVRKFRPYHMPQFSDFMHMIRFGAYTGSDIKNVAVTALDALIRTYRTEYNSPKCRPSVLIVLERILSDFRQLFSTQTDEYIQHKNFELLLAQKKNK
jgi:hypothetical protein